MTNAALIKIIQQGQILNRYQNIKRFITLYSYFSNERLRYYYGSMFLKNAQTGILLRLHSKYHRPLLHVRADYGTDMSKKLNIISMIFTTYSQNVLTFIIVGLFEWPSNPVLILFITI